MNKFERVTLNLERTMALANLLTICETEGVKVREVASFQNGFQVLFDGTNGDAILHDGSYGRSMCLWETYGFPWDEGDVSTHTAEELAELVSELQKKGD